MNYEVNDVQKSPCEPNLGFADICCKPFFLDFRKHYCQNLPTSPESIMFIVNCVKCASEK